MCDDPDIEQLECQMLMSESSHSKIIVEELKKEATTNCL